MAGPFAAASAAAMSRGGGRGGPRLLRLPPLLAASAAAAWLLLPGPSSSSPGGRGGLGAAAFLGNAWRQAPARSGRPSRRGGGGRGGGGVGEAVTVRRSKRYHNIIHPKRLMAIHPTTTAPPRISQYKGVTWNAANHLWQAEATDPATGRCYNLGLHEAECDAARAYDCAFMVLLAENNASESEVENMNFPNGPYRMEDLMDITKIMESMHVVKPSSKYHGVYRSGGRKTWRAEIKMHTKLQFLDHYDTELEAAEAVDKAIRSTGVEKALCLQQLNFKLDSDYFDEETWDEELIPRGASSRFLGVSFHQPSGQYLAKVGRKHVGLYETEYEAAKAFDKASAAVGGLTNFKPKRLPAAQD